MKTAKQCYKHNTHKGLRIYYRLAYSRHKQSIQHPCEKINLDIPWEANRVFITLEEVGFVLLLRCLRHQTLLRSPSNDLPDPARAETCYVPTLQTHIRNPNTQLISPFQIGHSLFVKHLSCLLFYHTRLCHLFIPWFKTWLLPAHPLLVLLYHSRGTTYATITSTPGQELIDEITLWSHPSYLRSHTQQRIWKLHLSRIDSMPPKEPVP